MNGRDGNGVELRRAVRAALEADDLEPLVRRLLELRFPAERTAGASLWEAAASLGWSPAMAAHVEFSALCGIAARAERRRDGAEQSATAGARPNTDDERRRP